MPSEAIHTEDPNLVQYIRNTTLLQASEEGKLDVVKYILSHGLEDINCREKQRGRTPVMLAARQGHLRVFDYLFSQGCDLYAVDDNKQSVLHIACTGGNADIVRKLIVCEKLDIESKGRYGRRPIMWAACWGQREVFELLVGMGCNLTTVDDQKNNILHMSCFFGKLKIVKVVLSLNKVSLESRGLFNMTPVLAAVYNGNKEIFDLLKNKDCNLKALADTGNTILHTACKRHHAHMVKYFLTLRVVQGMEKVKNKYGLTPVQEAEKSGDDVIVRLLKGRN